MSGNLDQSDCLCINEVKSFENDKTTAHVVYSNLMVKTSEYQIPECRIVVTI